jgi:hypothetical protein
MEIARRVTTQDISWFLDLYRNEQLDLDPPYQRRSVWTPKDRRYFLDTIFRGYPSPTIFIHKVLQDGKTIYSVVDGKQRLETIFKFIDNKMAIDKDFGDNRLNGKKWSDLEETDFARPFWDYVLPVEFINVNGDTGFVNEVFDRLNRNSRKLVEQELRHAKYDGWFISFVEGESTGLDWKDLGIVTTSRARRMKDVQFLSELLIVQLKQSVSGFDQGDIDEYYAYYDDPSELEDFDEEAIITEFVKGRRYLIEMEKHDATVTTYAKDFKNFYSLWALVVTEDSVPTPAELAPIYSAFMKEVDSFKDHEVAESYIAGGLKVQFPSSFKYYQNGKGASTDEPQRVSRHEALIEMLG